MSTEETAALLGIRPETVKTRLHRGRRLLRAALIERLRGGLRRPLSLRRRALRRHGRAGARPARGGALGGPRGIGHRSRANVAACSPSRRPGRSWLTRLPPTGQLASRSRGESGLYRTWRFISDYSALLIVGALAGLAWANLHPAGYHAFVDFALIDGGPIGHLHVDAEGHAHRTLTVHYLDQRRADGAVLRHRRQGGLGGGGAPQAARCAGARR